MVDEINTASTLTYLDAYCERSGDASFWGEPLNAITNLAFILCALMAYRLIKSIPDKRFKSMGDIWTLIFCMFAIGIGSGLWHTHTRPWTVIADIIPIYIFINVTIFSLTMRLLQFSWWQALVIWLGFIMLTIAFETGAPRDLLNGSVMYLPTYLMLGFIIALLSLKKHYKAWRDLTAILLVFTASLFFRTIDMEVCAQIPTGTHFLWHMLNAWVLYSIVKLIADSKRAIV